MSILEPEIPPFDAATPAASDDLALALAIEDDAAALRTRGTAPSLERYLDAVPELPQRADALDAAIACVLAASPTSPLDAARELARRFPALTDSILANALSVGIVGEAPPAFRVGETVLGRWHLQQHLGAGETADAWLARDEVLSRPANEVEVVIKRFDDAIGPAAREHALREARALVQAPAGCAPAVVALHAPRGEAAILVVRHEPSREARTTEDVAAALATTRRLHAAGIAHGDLKPAHIRIRDDGTAFLLDLGSADVATPAACLADLARLAASARALAVGRVDRQISRFAVWASARGKGRAARVALAAVSPRARARVARRGIILAVLAASALMGGSMVGSRLALDNLPARTRAGLALDAQLASGRLRRIEVDGNGHILSIRLALPELKQIKRPGTHVLMDELQLLPDGGVRFVNPVVQEIPQKPSQPTPPRQ